eukprot:SAG11_NODE_7882_length_1085_cov_1.309331_1_plen_63_part_00
MVEDLFVLAETVEDLEACLGKEQASVLWPKMQGMKQLEKDWLTHQVGVATKGLPSHSLICCA